MRLDWNAYFKEFSRIHGGDPVLWRRSKEFNSGGLLLFRDGWAYSAADRTGPEYPPPDNPRQLKHLVRVYWALRKRILKEELRLIREQIVDFVRTQQQRNAPLQVRSSIIVTGDDGQRTRQALIEDVNYDLLLDMGVQLSEDIKSCDECLISGKVPEGGLQVDDFSPASLLARLKQLG